MKMLVGILYLLLTAMVVQAAHTNGVSQNTRSNELTAGESGFVKNTAMHSACEVALGELALRKTQNEWVKNFARRMVEDHKDANKKLKRIAVDKGCELPEDNPPCDKMQRKLEDLDGDAFDREYIAMMVGDHEQVVASFESHANVEDADLREFVNDTLPILRQHLEQVRDVNKTLNP